MKLPKKVYVYWDVSQGKENPYLIAADNEYDAADPNGGRREVGVYVLDKTITTKLVVEVKDK